MASVDTEIEAAGRGPGRRPPRRCSEQREAMIDSLNDDGCGVARIDGKVAFIEGALPGERVLFCVDKKRRSYDHGWMLELLAAAPARVSPQCRHFGVCGGCSLQHLEAAAQLPAKEAQLRDKFRHFGQLQPDAWLPPLTGPVWAYRRSARLGVRNVPKKGGVIVGFRERGTTYITPLQECPVLDARVGSLLPALRDLIAGLSRPDRLPQVEVACGDEEAALVFRHLEVLTDPDLGQLREFGRRHGVRIYLQPGRPDTIAALWPEHPGPLAYRLPEFDVTIQFEPAHFIQVNAEVNRGMVTQAVELLDPQADETVVDLFCGLGNFTLPIARRAARVVGVEADGRLLAAARANAERNGIANAEFRQADLYDPGQAAAFWDGAACDKLLLDPPRSGAIEVVKHLPKRAPRRIVYVSCSPATLARDAEYLVNVRGYRLLRAGVMNMFPHTSHVESIALFEQQ